MKKLFTMVIAAACFAACNNSATENTDTDTIATVPVTTETFTAYTPAEGDVRYKDAKVYIMRNGEWVEAKDDITLDNGIVVYKTGKVKKDQKEIELKEGEIVNKTGDFFDRTGKAIANAWDDTKDAVKDAGEAVGDAAKKVGKKVDSVATGKHRE